MLILIMDCISRELLDKCVPDEKNDYNSFSPLPGGVGMIKYGGDGRSGGD
jgi:hypothetical protein